MNKVYKCAIIGGGASGLLLAVELFKGKNALNNGEVIIFERLDRVGKKLLVTGNGQGNLTNSDISINNYYGDKNFIENFLLQEKEIDLKNYLYNLGIPLTFDKNGKGYPISKQASYVLDNFRFFIQDKADIKINFYVNNVTKKGDIFEITNGQEIIYAKNVVFCCGGKCAKQFGTDGSSYSLLEKFGHKVTKLYPSLVQLKTDKEKIKGLSGLKETVKAYSLYNGKIIKESYGDLLFTDYGVSGNAIFSLSSSICDKENCQVKIEFLPNIDAKELKKIIIDKKNNTPFYQDKDIYAGLINKKIGEAIYKTAKDNSVDSLIYALKNYTLNIVGCNGFDNAQVTKGGIKTDLIDINYQSKLENGIFVAGEMLDIDGDCGGYNLTFAFVSAIVIARYIKNVR